MDCHYTDILLLVTCEEIPRLLVLGGMSSRWERGAEGGDCYNGADKAKQQEVSTHTNTNTNSDTDRNANTIWAGDVHT